MGDDVFSENNRRLPPDVQDWIDKRVIQLRDTLDNPEVRARILELLHEPTIRLGTDDENR
jgi:hypothetical protein